jgi:SAM-dependent methyltransferase
MQNLILLLEQVLMDRALINAILSGGKLEINKIQIRPLLIKGQLYYQWTETRGSQVFHRNLTPAECQAVWQTHILHFKQMMLYTPQFDYQVLMGKKQATILKKPPSRAAALPLAHNRQKEYLIEEGTPIAFLVELGIMSASGKVHASKRDKFRQINRFLEMVSDVLPALNSKHPLHIVDFGCGKSYLTFALYYYFKVMQGLNVTLSGVDLKTDVIEHCQQLAHNLGYEGLHFVVGNINEYTAAQNVDMVVSLHACDTATDAAIEKAVRWQARVILCVPCCQHELLQQVQNKALVPLLKHGILKERFAALATDAARAQLLEALGYRVQVLEFIDVEHTPKNLLIRAILQDKASGQSKAWQEYLAFKNNLAIDPSLERRFKKELNSLT